MVTIVRCQPEAGFEQPARDRAAHVADPDKSEPSVFLRNWFHDELPLGLVAISISLSTWIESTGRTVSRGASRFTQHVGRKGDTKLNSEEFSSSSRGLPVESLDGCQSVGGCLLLYGNVKSQSQKATRRPESRTIVMVLESLPGVMSPKWCEEDRFLAGRRIAKSATASHYCSRLWEFVDKVPI